MIKIAIARPINGVSINGNEYLLDNNNQIMTFENVDLAVQYLKEEGLSDGAINYLQFIEVFEFTTDIGTRVNMLEKDFIAMVKETIEFAVNEKDYDLKDLTSDFIAEDITGKWGNHGFSQDYLKVIDNVLKEMA